MKTPQVGALPGMAPLGITNKLSQDQAEIARRKAAAPMLAPKPQVACDHGLFGDSAAQIDLLNMPGVRK